MCQDCNCQSYEEALLCAGNCPETCDLLRREQTPEDARLSLRETGYIANQATVQLIETHKQDI